MQLPFNEALADLLQAYVDLPIEDVIDDLETMLEGLYDDLKQKREDV